MSRRLDVLFAPPFPPERTRGMEIVVLDVLRATTTIAVALANGAAGVVPVAAAEDAVDIGKRLGRDRVLLCGERDSVLIPGFDLDNSPASYTRDAVEGKTLLLTTTNGTRALRAASAASSVRAGALVNRSAVATALGGGSAPILLLCAGVNGRFALEDAIGAGALVDALLEREPDLELSDGARGSALLYRSVRDRLADAIASSEHAHGLAELGFGPDIAFASELDVLEVAPILREGMLVTANGTGEPASGAFAQTQSPDDAATLIARRVESDLPVFRARYADQYAMRGTVRASLLTGALHAYLALAFREGRADEALRAVSAALEDALAADAPRARDVVEEFLEPVSDWQPPQRDALERAIGVQTAQILATMRAPQGA